MISRPPRTRSGRNSHNAKGKSINQDHNTRNEDSHVETLLMLCLVRVNDFGRNGMKNELSYGQFLRNFILSFIPFLTSCSRYHTFNLRWNAPFSPIFNFFSNLIIAILHFLTIFSKFSSYLY